MTDQAMRYLAAPEIAERLPAASVLLVDYEVVRPPLHLTVVGHKDDPAAPSGRPMHKATMLRAIDAVVEASGIAASRAARASPQTLRNTFAADLFESGTEPERVGQWLGFQQPISSHRLHRAWQQWMGEEIRERDIARARDNGDEDAV